jgi:hypothetical protein
MLAINASNGGGGTGIPWLVQESAATKAAFVNLV